MNRLRLVASMVALTAALAACEDRGQRESTGDPGSSPGLPPATTTSGPPPEEPPARDRPVTLGFAGDVHFEEQLAPLLRRPATALGPIATALRRPDVMMVNLESAITDRGRAEPKRYHFRTSPRALGALDAAGVDVASMANNHAVDFGRVGFRDTLTAVRRSPIPVVGIGRTADAAFRPHVVSVRGTSIAVLAATTKTDRTTKVWAAGSARPGVAAAVTPRSRLLGAVRAADARADVVVVYLHWGQEYESCPSRRSRSYVRALSAAGSDVVLGSHAHTLLGAGWLGQTYVDYGLGNFVWYNQNSTRTGILTLTIRNDRVLADSFAPARIHPDGRPRLVHGEERVRAVDDWRRLRECTGLARNPAR